MPKIVSTYPDKILKAAIKVFAENGEQAIMSQVAKKANLPESTIYRYFPSRMALVLRIHNHFWDVIEAELHSAIETSIWDEETPSVSTKLKRIMEYCQRFISLNKELIQAVMSTFLPDSEKIQNENLKKERLKIQEKKQQVLMFFDKLVEEGQGEGCFTKTLNPKVIRQIILGCFQELAHGLLFQAKEGKFNAGYLPTEAMRSINHVILGLAK